MTSPYAVLEDLPDIKLRRTSDDLALKGRRARWFPHRSLILVDSRVRRLVQRCSVAHELGHVMLGHGASCGDEFFDYRAELAADEWAARLLLDDVPTLIIELATTHNHGHAANNLNVTLDLLETRLRTMTPDEAALVDELVREIHESGGC